MAYPVLMHAFVRLNLQNWLNINRQVTLQRVYFRNLKNTYGFAILDVTRLYLSQNVDEVDGNGETLVYGKSDAISYGMVSDGILDFATNHEYVVFEADITALNDTTASRSEATQTLNYLKNAGVLEILNTSENSDEMSEISVTEVPTVTGFTAKLNNFLEHFNNNYFSDAALLSLQKTFQSKNITIQEWNTIVEYLKENLSDVTTLKNLLLEISKFVIVKEYPLEQIREAIAHIEDNYVSLEIASYEPANMRGNRRVWLDTEPSEDNDQIIIPQRVLSPTQINETFYDTEDNGAIIDEPDQSQEVFFDLDEQENFFETEDNGVIIEER